MNSIPCGACFHAVAFVLATLYVSPCVAEEAAASASSAESQVKGLIDSGRYQAAFQAMEKEKAFDSTGLPPRLLRAQALLGIGKYKDVSSVLTENDGPQALGLLAQSAEAEGELDRALQLMTRAVDEKRKSLTSTETVEGASALAESLTTLGEIALRAGQLDLAKTQFQQAVSLVNRAHAKLHELGIPHDEADPRMFATGATAGLARIFTAKGENPRAERTWRGVAGRSDDPVALVGLASHVLARNDAKTAKRHLDRALRLTEGKPNHRRTRALILADRGDTAEALSLAQAAFADGPNLYASDTLAWVLHKQGKHDEARQYINQALASGTRDPLILCHAGLIAHAQGEKALAKDRLTQVLQNNPAFDPLFALEARRVLDQLR